MSSGTIVSASLVGTACPDGDRESNPTSHTVLFTDCFVSTNDRFCKLLNMKPTINPKGIKILVTPKEFGGKEQRATGTPKWVLQVCVIEVEPLQGSV